MKITQAVKKTYLIKSIDKDSDIYETKITVISKMNELTLLTELEKIFLETGLTIYSITEC